MRSLFDPLHTPSSLSPLSGELPGRVARGGGLGWFVVCLLAGLLQAASLAWPLHTFTLPGWATGEPAGVVQIASLAWLALALRHVHRVRQGAWRAWVFATAWLAGTFWWLFVSMHTYGGLHAALAALAVLALAGFLALYYALAAAVLCALAPRSRAFQALLFAAVWTLAELMRGRWLTGFPWGAGGYAQVDLLGAWAPWIGVYGMGALAAWLAYSLAVWLPALVSRLGAHPRAVDVPVRHSGSARSPGAIGVRVLPWVGLLVLTASVAMPDVLRQAALREQRAVGELPVWLLQGNVPQDQKFEAGTGLAFALDWYPRQLAEATRAAADRLPGAPRLVVAPETAIPLLPQQLGPGFMAPLLETLAQRDTPPPQQLGALFGLPLGSFETGYTNGVWGIAPAQAAQGQTEAFYRYQKHHLVPFGEFIPPLFRWFTDLMNIPLGDFDRGALPQPAWDWAGQRIAPNICYEDLFGEELAAAFRDPAQAPTMLVNLSNIGWFGDTVAIDQHLHISRLRAMELGRPMLRATNTGATAVIDHRGLVTHQLPRLTRGRLEASAEGRDGLTPYARWASSLGLMPLWGWGLFVVLWAALARWRRGAGR